MQSRLGKRHFIFTRDFESGRRRFASGNELGWWSTPGRVFESLRAMRHPQWSWTLLASAVLLLACGARGKREPPLALATAAPTDAAPPEEAEPRPSVVDAGDARVELTSAPEPADPADPALEEWLALCGSGERSLHEVAQRVSELRQDNGEPPEHDLIVHLLRQRGAPYVQPRIWSARVPLADDLGARQQLAARIGRWAQRRARGALRCGIGEVASSDGSRVLALVQVDARADLAPLPTRSPVGQWLELKTRLLTPATGAAALVLPPEGRPRPLTLTQAGAEFQARFLVDRPGTWIVQVLSNDEGGALPVLESYIDVGPGPFPPLWRKAAPGEAANELGMREEQALLAMVNEARRLAGLAPLVATARLSALAQDHAEELRERGVISHDVGAGSPERRVEEVGLPARHVGENVARAPSVVRAYRALWASPSHRGNLLFPYFDEIGIGVSRDDGGMLYASLLFIGSR